MARALFGFFIDSAAAMKVGFHNRRAEFFFKAPYVGHVGNIKSYELFTIVYSTQYW